MHKKQNTIKIKVIGWFLLAALAVLLTGIISYNSYRELLSSLGNPTNQESKLKKLGAILADITEAEASMRAYALTRDDTLLDNYQNLVTSINHQLESIKSIVPVDGEFNIKVDSISQLLSNQSGGIASFIELKNTLNTLSFSSKALDEIGTTTDSIPTLRTTTTTTTTTTTVEPLPLTEENQARRNTKRQQKKRTQEIAREIAKLEEEPQVQTHTQVTTDTSFVQPDTVLTNIQQILMDISEEESKYQEVMAEKELELIESSMVIIDQIRGLIGGLEKQELAMNIQQANNAKVIASRSTLTISIIIFVCLVLGIIFTYLIFRDVKIGDYYNLQLIGEKNEAEQLADSKQQFLANMSHEIRTPLNAIIGFTEQLFDTTLKPKQQQYLKAVHSSSQHLLQTVNDILDYSKIEAGELKIVQVTFELGETLNQVLNAFELNASEKAIDLSLEVSPVQPVYLEGDPFRLKQILFNLVGNGIKFTDSGYVKIICDYVVNKDLVQVNLSIKDSGIGIPIEKHAEIFNDFKQVDTSDTRQYEGTGLGLAICKQLVELQNGKISLSSVENQGSEFLVNMQYPLSRSQSEPDNKPEMVDSRQGTLQHLKLLVADDDAFNIQLMKTILQKWGANTYFCSNGKEAMDQVKEHYFDLILTDIHMPEAGGVALSRFIRSLDDPEKHKIPIIALTANVMKTDLQKYQQAGINDFVLKPFTENELYQKLIELVSLERSVNKTEPISVSLDDFKKFSGGDDEALLPILKTFYENLKENVDLLEDLSGKTDMKTIAELAHKMISSFGHIQALEPVKKLRLLETKIREEEKNIPVKQIVVEISALSKPIFVDLEKAIEALKS